MGVQIYADPKEFNNPSVRSRGSLVMERGEEWGRVDPTRSGRPRRFVVF